MAKAGYSVVTSGAVALAAAATKSVLGVRSNGAFGLDLKKLRYGFDGTTATFAPVLLELCHATFATNQPGTQSTSLTPVQLYGRAIVHGVTAAKNCTAEPTILTVIEEEFLTPNGGALWYDWPLGDTPDCDVNQGFVLRATTAAGVTAGLSNARESWGNAELIDVFRNRTWRLQMRPKSESAMKLTSGDGVGATGRGA